MVDKVRARDGQCKLAPDLEPSPFYTKPSRPCAKDDDGVEKYNILPTCKRRRVYRSHRSLRIQPAGESILENRGALLKGDHECLPLEAIAKPADANSRWE